MKKSKFKKSLAVLSSACVMASAIPPLYSSAASYPLGDFNCDGSLNASDALGIQQFATGIITADSLSELTRTLSDANQDGKTAVADAVYVAQMVSLEKWDFIDIEDSVTDITYIHLMGDSITVEGNNAVAEGSKVTISASGTYYVDGTLNDGQIYINIADETVDSETVKIFLNNANITGLSAPAIFVENAENTSINLVEGTVNTISDGTTAYEGDYLENGVIESKDDITIKGNGQLNITANTQYAIQCNNDIKFTEGNVNIETLTEDAVRGKTSVTVKGTAVLDIESEGDGIKSTKGNVAVEGGTISIKAGNDAIQSETTIDISSGSVTASGDRGLTGTTGVNITGGTVIATATDSQTDETLLTSTQGTMLLNCIADATNTTDGCWKKANTIVVNDSITVTPLKKYMYVLVSDASITPNSVYTLTNGSTGATVTHTDSTISEFTLSDSAITTFNNVNPAGSEQGTVNPDISLDGYTITLANDGISTNAPAETATVSDGVCTIFQPGVFAVSGNMSEGQIVVNVDKNTYADGVVELDLMGIDLTNTTDTPIYVASIGDEVQIVAKNGYDNVISDGTSYTNADAGMGAIYSCDDLKIKGSGNLTVNGNAGDGIVCKNDLKIYNGNITVNAADDCIRGKDSVTIGDIDDTDFSSLNITVNSSAGDGIKSNATDTSTADKTYGEVTVNGGNINITSYSDGIHAAQNLNINGGNFTIKTTCNDSSSSGASAKGLKSGATDDTTGTSTVGTININGGYINADTTDDCIHASGDISLIGGTMELSSADDAVHSDANLTIGQGNADTYNDVQVIIYSAYEGIEGLNITMNSGTVISTTTDDGFNAAGGADGSGSTSPGGWGGNQSTGGSGNYSLNLKGGFAIVSTASGDHDGFDSNGALTISGGIHVTNGQDAFDCDGSMSYTGGVYVKNTGSGGMGGGMMPGGSGSMTESVNVSASVNAGERISLCDGSGNVIVSFIADKNVSSLIAGCTAYSGASFYTGGTLANTTYFQEIDQTQLAGYGGTLSGGTQLSGSGNTTNPWG